MIWPKGCSRFPQYNTTGRVFSGTLGILKKRYKKPHGSSFDLRSVQRNCLSSLLTTSRYIWIHFSRFFRTEVARFTAVSGFRRQYVWVSPRWSFLEYWKYLFGSINPRPRHLSVWTTINLGFFLRNPVVRRWCRRRLWRMGRKQKLGSKALQNFQRRRLSANEISQAHGYHFDLM